MRIRFNSGWIAQPAGRLGSQLNLAIAVGMALVSGCLMSLAAAPTNAWWLAWVALVPLWVLMQAPLGQSRWRWVLPLLWGLGYHGVALAWIGGLHPLTWMGIPGWASVAIVVAVWSVITLWGVVSVGLWAWGLAWASRRGLAGWGRVWVGTALWCLIEALRSTSDLDWTSLAYTQSPGNLVILHLGQLSGNLTVTAAIVAVNGVLAEAWLARSQAHRRWLGAAAIALVLISHGVGGALYRQALDDRPAQVIPVGIVQGNVPTRIKLFPVGIQRALAHYTQGYRVLAHQGVRAVLTSEGALPLIWKPQTANPLQAAIQEFQVPLWLGAFGRVNEATAPRLSQSLLALDGQGQIRSQYNKVKLVPLGESLPFEPLLGQFIGRLSPIQSYLQPGRGSQRFESGLGPAAVGICYESAFGELFRQQVRQGAEFLLTASNLDPYSTVLMAQHEAHDVMRAIETDRWMARATNTGYSGIIDPHGQIHWRSHPHRFEVHADRLYRRRTQTLYVRYGNWLTPVLLVGAVGCLWRVPRCC